MKTKINIGCGYRTMPDYINADINPDLPNIDLICSLDSIPLEDGTLEEVFASHCIEHIPFTVGMKALKEWYRVLKEGGVAIIDTPNLKRNAALYMRDDAEWMQDYYGLTSEEKKRLLLNGEPNKTLWVNFKMFSSEHLYDVHYINYDPELLTACCLEAGFSKVDVMQTNPSLMVRATK